MDTDSLKNSLLEDIDLYRDKEIRKLTKKWTDLSKRISEMGQFGSNEMEQYTKIFQNSLHHYEDC